MTETVTGPDGRQRCRWCAATSEYMDYHDREWGFPVAGDVRLFEKLSLESFQSGLSWRTILVKRESFRSAFLGFDFWKIAKFDDEDVARLLEDRAIVRHRGKIEATVNNARRACELVEDEGSLAAFIWRFEPLEGELETAQNVSVSPASIRLSRELKKRGWKFLGPTTVHAFMQAMGLINDHVPDCEWRKEAYLARKGFVPPG